MIAILRLSFKGDMTMYPSTEISHTDRNVCQSNPNATPETSELKTRPRTDIRETDRGYLLLVDMPGVDESHVDVIVEKGVLTIRGEAGFEAPEGFEHVHKEADSRKYERVFRLPEEVDVTGLTASVKNG